jgi:hypothetical protein
LQVTLLQLVASGAAASFTLPPEAARVRSKSYSPVSTQPWATASTSMKMKVIRPTIQNPLR